MIFIAGLFTYAGLSATNTLPEIMKIVDESSFENEEQIKSAITDVETEISENCYKRYDLIEAYGEVNKLLGKTVEVE